MLWGWMWLVRSFTQQRMDLVGPWRRIFKNETGVDTESGFIVRDKIVVGESKRVAGNLKDRRIASSPCLESCRQSRGTQGRNGVSRQQLGLGRTQSTICYFPPGEERRSIQRISIRYGSYLAYYHHEQLVLWNLWRVLFFIIIVRLLESCLVWSWSI